MKARLLVAAGGILLATSIFLPRPGIGSLQGELVSWSEALALTYDAEDAPFSELVPLVGIVLAIAFVPVAGLIALLSALLPAGAQGSRTALALLGIVQLVFLGTFVFLGVAGTIVHDQWLPAAAYPSIAGAGMVTLGVTAWVMARAHPCRRLFRAQIPTLTLLVLIFFGVAGWLFLGTKHSWSPWGLAASGLGALIALVGCTRIPLTSAPEP